ncbi:Hcp family type VI secretion system effector [Paraburkholderia phymatum]|uniref:Hcp family type VI secretion system effector n=1 Tax=Paraburkholderia phymatum TaxID=148447 RepID=A0ACC6TSS4_9BURK
MAIPLHLWLKDSNGADIVGSSKVSGRDGSIEVLSVAHGMSTPVDGHTGRLMGTRVHRPLCIEKEIDRASPILYRAIARSELLGEAILRWYRVDEAGNEVEYFRMTMTGVRVSSISPRMPNFKDQTKQTQNHTELVELRYSSITWAYLDGNLIFKDDWNELPF